MSRKLRSGCMCTHALGVRVGDVWEFGGQKLQVSDDCKFHAGMSIWAADEFDTIPDEDRSNNG